MARVTIEDCTAVIPSRFELVVLAAQRAKEISSGARITVERDNDKNPVVALREIAGGHLTIEGMRDVLVKKLQKRHSIEDHAQADDLTHKEVAEEISMLTEDDSEEIYGDEADIEEELDEKE